ncbi:MAG: hypothetical protein ACLPX9_13895 [Rhodomicrobium sp.]
MVPVDALAVFMFVLVVTLAALAADALAALTLVLFDPHDIAWRF